MELSVNFKNAKCNFLVKASIKGSNAAEEAGINVTQAQELPGRCGQAVNPISCLKGIYTFLQTWVCKCVCLKT